MSRYIEHDYIGSAVAHLPTKPIQTEHGIELVVSVTDVIEIIKNAPSINIVRCVECKRENYELSGIRCGLSDALMGEDGCCSIGERKEQRWDI